MPWNRGPHKRKFIRIRGTYVAQTADAQIKDAVLGFWGEWEPQSTAMAIAAPLPGGPAWIHEPFYSPPADNSWRQNTDPCVFGGFRYTCCQQHVKRRPTGMQRLESGSMILFGSYVADRFVLDTVFVIGKGDRAGAVAGVEHDSTTFRRLRGVVPAAYLDVTLEPWYSEDPAEPCRLYDGATVDAPIDGMYSFFPCLPWTDGRNGFARPHLDLPGVMTQSQRQGRRVSVVTERVISSLWAEVGAQVVSQGLQLGVSAEMPPRR